MSLASTLFGVLELSETFVTTFSSLRRDISSSSRPSVLRSLAIVLSRSERLSDYAISLRILSSVKEQLPGVDRVHSGKRGPRR
jgi:hypothetical protein